MLFQQEPEIPQADGGLRFFWMMVQTLFVLAFVCALAYLVLRLLPRLNARISATGMVQIVERVPLDQRRSLYVIKVTGRWLLISASEGGVHLVQELDPEIAGQEAEARVRGSTLGARELISERFARLLRRRP